MPAGVPVACMSIGKSGARNAAIFTLEILAITDKKLQLRLAAYKKEMRRQIKQLKIKI
jgi:phosphoribosylcarboxyaminoimidazole (NCAIR) mutase